MTPEREALERAGRLADEIELDKKHGTDFDQYLSSITPTQIVLEAEKALATLKREILNRTPKR